MHQWPGVTGELQVFQKFSLFCPAEKTCPVMSRADVFSGAPCWELKNFSTSWKRKNCVRGRALGTHRCNNFYCKFTTWDSQHTVFSLVCSEVVRNRVKRFLSPVTSYLQSINVPETMSRNTFQKNTTRAPNSTEWKRRTHTSASRRKSTLFIQKHQLWVSTSRQLERSSLVTLYFSRKSSGSL